VSATIFWWPLIAVTLHIIEEFVFPGGFAAWDRAYRPEIAGSITPRFHIVVNGALLFVCLAIAVAGSTRMGVAGWLTAAALLASNAFFHIVGAFRTRRYSPGVVTGVTLYIPMAVFGFVHFVAGGDASAGTAISAILIGGSYHWWSRMLHRARVSENTT